jgi:hypothetical protein
MGAQAAVEFRALMRLIPDECRPKMEWAVPVFEQDTISQEQKLEFVEF